MGVFKNLFVGVFDVIFGSETFALEITGCLLREDGGGYNIMLNRDGAPYATIGYNYQSYIGGINGLDLWGKGVDPQNATVIEGRRRANAIVTAFKVAMRNKEFNEGVEAMVPPKE